MQEPSKEKIDEIKAKFPERSLHLVEAVDGNGKEGSERIDADTVAYFVMTGPSTDEYKKFTDELAKANEIKTPADQVTALRGAIERGALAQIRWPDRETCQTLFNNRPAMVYGFAKELHNSAGSNIEFRSTKL